MNGSFIKTKSSVFLRIFSAAGLTVLLLVFLVATRWFSAMAVPDQLIREVELVEAIAMPAPPPPPEDFAAESEPPPPPPPPTDLPRLDLQVEEIAPPVAAVLDQTMDLTMAPSDFELEMDPVSAPPSKTKSIAKADTPKIKTSSPSSGSAPKPKPSRTTFSSGELDVKPRLSNRPAATFPSAMLRRGVKQGKVLLEVSISPTGRCTVRRVIASSHPEFSAMARSFASKARFSAPKKDGRAVTAIYRWPLILKP